MMEYPEIILEGSWTSVYALGWAWEYMMVDLGLDLERIKYAQVLGMAHGDSVW